MLEQRGRERGAAALARHVERRGVPWFVLLNTATERAVPFHAEEDCECPKGSKEKCKPSAAVLRRSSADLRRVSDLLVLSHP